MNLRFSLGNIVGVVTTVAGYVVEHADSLTALSKYGTPLVAVGTIVLALTKGLVTHNADQIAPANKVQAGPVLFQRTGLLKKDPEV